MKELINFTTTQCDVIVLDTKQNFEGKRLYVVKSYHRADHYTNVRFGTPQQLYNILNCYRYSVTSNEKEYEQFVRELSIRKIS